MPDIPSVEPANSFTTHDIPPGQSYNRHTMNLTGPLQSHAYPLLALIDYPRINPDIFSIGPITIRWYGVAYLLGFMLGYGLLRRLVRTGFLKLSLDQLSDLLTWIIVGVIAGGRLGWWLFYHRTEGPEPWWEPIAIWHGGMSFHGGLLGVILAILIYTRVTKHAFWNTADALALATPVGLLLGRLANFINGELYGRATDVPWAMIFPSDATQLPRHPSQLYEAFLEGIALLAALWLAKGRLGKTPGRIASLFVILYAAFRFTVEFTREPDPQLGYIAWGWLTMGQILSLIFLLAGVIMWISRRAGTPANDPIASGNP